MSLAQAIQQQAREYHKQQMIMHGRNHYTKRLVCIDLPGRRAIGALFNLTSLWIGVHYSKRDRRFCLNVLPCCTVWWTRKDGVIP